MLKLIFAVLLSSLLITSSGLAAVDDCAPIDMSQNGSMANVPVSNQGNAPACYAYAAASMVQAYSSFVLHQTCSVTGNGIYELVHSLDPWVLDANTGRTCNAIQLAGRSQPGVPSCVNFDFTLPGGRELHSASDFAAEIHRNLTESPLPIAIEYCSGVLLADGNYISRREFHQDLNYLNESASTDNFTADCKFHASVVIGQKRMEDGNCYFLVQNSWGDDCSIYPSDTRPCVGGRIWVPADQLSQNIFRIVRFQQ